MRSFSKYNLKLKKDNLMMQCLHTETDCLHADLEIAEVRIFSSLP